jgi:alpha-tubulin suppressor-like RCC1 family protein
MSRNPFEKLARSLLLSFGQKIRISRRKFFSRLTKIVGGIFFVRPLKAQATGLNLGAFWKATPQTLWMWGDNSYGEQGNGSTIGVFTPTQLGSGQLWADFSGGEEAFALGVQSNGTLWAWGSNSYGQLGTGAASGNGQYSASPTQVGNLQNWLKVSAGYCHSLAIKNDGTLWAWGYNGYGSLGVGDITNRSSPIQVGSLKTWASIKANPALGYVGSSLATKTDGTLWAWGANNYGQLGLGDVVSRSSPSQVGALTNWAQVSAGGGSIVGVKKDGTLWAWGRNNWGALGIGATGRLSSPVQVGSLTNWSQVSVGGYRDDAFTLALKTDGTLWGWGYNRVGQLGIGNITDVSSPVQVGTLTSWSQVSAGYTHALAIKKDGTLWGWGYSYTSVGGYLGTGNRTSTQSPVQVGSLTNWTQVASGKYQSVAIKNDGTVWSWGSSAGKGILGLGNQEFAFSPTQVGALTNWSKIESGMDSSTSIKTDGTLWAWGYNNSGQLGLGDTATRSSPVQVGALNTWAQVTGNNATFAIKTDGTLWAWGSNTRGQLGIGSVVGKSSPVQVGALTNWKSISSPGYATCAIKTDGTLWAWGYNSAGQLGIGSIANKSSPVQVGALTTWSQTVISNASTFAVKTDGTLWAWGDNSSGVLCQGDLVSRSSPVQVGALTNWAQLAGYNTSVLAIKTDGTLWGWGQNNTGQLGLGNEVNRSSPVQIGALTNWSKISIGNGFTTAIKTDGTLWAWGTDGADYRGDPLGIGDGVSRSSPVQIGSFTDWVKVSAGGRALSMGMRKKPQPQ